MLSNEPPSNFVDVFEEVAMEPLFFLHHARRGRSTRLSIRTKDPNNHSDTETGTLSSLLVQEVTYPVFKSSSSFANFQTPCVAC